METGERSCSHWLDLNDLHLALARAHMLFRWTPASEICSQNDLTQFKYAKDYDAVVAVESEGREMRFGLEYERTPKTYNAYRRIASKLDGETLGRHCSVPGLQLSSSVYDPGLHRVTTSSGVRCPVC